MDTKKLRFQTNNESLIEDEEIVDGKYCFYLVGFRISEAIDEKTLNEPFEYIISILFFIYPLFRN